MKYFIILIFFLFACTSNNHWKCVNGDCIDGEGTKLWSDGGFEKGFWVHGKLNGNGSQFFGTSSAFSGDTYNGEFKDNSYEGRGIYFDKSEDVTYEGQFLKGKPTGKGKASWGKKSKFPNRYYDGEWKNGLMHGFGTKFWGEAGKFTNNKYVGMWQNNKMDGEGTYYWSDGSYFKGPWKNGKQYGYGTYVLKNGEVFKGYWNDGYCKELAIKLGLE